MFTLFFIKGHLSSCSDEHFPQSIFFSVKFLSSCLFQTASQWKFKQSGVKWGQSVNLPLERMSNQTHETNQSNEPKLVLKVWQLGKSHFINLQIISANKGSEN